MLAYRIHGCENVTLMPILSSMTSAFTMPTQKINLEYARESSGKHQNITAGGANMYI